MKRKLISKTITTILEYKDKTIITTTVKRQPGLVYFSGSDNLTKWDSSGDYIDLAPKGNFVTKFVKRLWNLRKLEKLFSSL